jgi:hypothetical protein
MKSFIDSSLFGFIFPFILFCSVAVGFYFAGRYQKFRKKAWVASGVESSIIGFFALLLSFSFLSANNEYRRRIAMVHEESDILAQMRRESLLMTEKTKTNVHEYLLSYLELKTHFANDKISRTEWQSKAEAVNGKMLDYIVQQPDSTNFTIAQQNQLLQKLNQLSSVFYRNQYSYNERTPGIIMMLLIISSLIVGLLVGFMNGFEDKKHYLVPLIYIVIVSFTMQSIRDLDDPLKGTIRPSVSNLEALYNNLKKSSR